VEARNASLTKIIARRRGSRVSLAGSRTGN
jgi:hypothetical protein